jgi:hypothetical protein
MGRELPVVFYVFSNHASKGLIWQHFVLYSLIETEIYAGIFETVMVVLLML